MLSGQKLKTENDRHKAEMIRAFAEAGPERLQGGFLNLNIRVFLINCFRLERSLSSDMKFSLRNYNFWNPILAKR